jgi:hypothetical protein
VIDSLRNATFTCLPDAALVAALELLANPAAVTAATRSAAATKARARPRIAQYFIVLLLLRALPGRSDDANVADC